MSLEIGRFVYSIRPPPPPKPTYRAIPHVGSKRRFFKAKGSEGAQRMKGGSISLQSYFSKTILFYR